MFFWEIKMGILAQYHVGIVVTLCFLVLLLGLLFWNAGKDNKELEEEIKKLADKNQELVTLSTTDPLTGVKNRRSFDESLASLLALLPTHPEDKRSCRINGLVLLMIDVDHFKLINDTYGHLVGDQYLKIVAVSIVDFFRSSDLIGRFGGEEFMVAVPGVTITEFKEKAEDLRKHISDALFKIGGQVVTVSIGALYTKYHQEATTLVEVADDALYEAKETGRNKVVTHVLD